MTEVDAAVADLRRAAQQFNHRRTRVLAEGTPADRLRLDEDLMAAERALLDPDGLPGRPWFRHSIFAPKSSYAPEVLPGVAEALAARDVDRATRQARRLARALRRAASALSGGTD
jgi:N-acetylated-alpha-linked acidic dipeptidase